MINRALFIFSLIVGGLFVIALPVAADDEFQEAVQQTEDQWKAIRGTMEEGKGTLDDLLEKYEEYKAAAFSDSPEKGIELARMLFNLDKSQTGAAEDKVKQLRQMFTELDSAGLKEKLEAASDYLDKANKIAGEVENIWEFTKKFNPENAKDNPTYGLRLIGSLLSESADKMEEIPLVGQILGKWIKAYGEVAVEFANALDRLSKKIDAFRGGSLCGQSGRRQDQQAAFTAAGGEDCLTHFASGIFPRMRGETYEGNTDYFLYDPATKRGYIASKEAETVYRWHERLLEPRALDPDWLAGRANSLKPEVKNDAREYYFLFSGWKNKSEPDWIIIDKLGLYQDAYFYGRLDEQTFMANYILTVNHHTAVDTVLKEYEKYVVVRGTVYEEEDEISQRSSGARVAFTVGGKSYSEMTEDDGRYEILIDGRVNDAIHEQVSKSDFDSIERDGRIPQKVTSGLNYTLIKGSSLAAIPVTEDKPRSQVRGSLFVSRDAAGTERITTAMAGQEVYLQVEIGASDLDRSDTVLVDLEVLLSDGRTVTLRPSAVPVRPGQMTGYGTAVGFLVEQDLPPGTCHITGTLRLGDQTVSIPGTTFEIEKLAFRIEELMISPGPELYYLGTRYAVGDSVHLRVDVTGARAGSGTPITAEWRLTLPDGRMTNLRQTRLLAAEGVSGSLTNTILTDENTPLGVYRVEVMISLEETEIAQRGGTFELVPLFEDPEILITDSGENTQSLETFRPGDPLFVITDLIYNSSDPNRVVHVSVEFTGPDVRIGALDIEGDQSPAQGSFRAGAARVLPAQIMEGAYTAVVTLDGGHDQILRLQESFRIVYPVQFEGIWTLDGSQPPQVKNRYSGNDPFEWLMRYRFSDTRPDDQYSSAVWTQFGDLPPVPMMSSDPMGPNTPFPGQATTSFTGIVPPDMPSAAYELAGVVWYNDVAYYSPVTTFKIGQEPTITITSPQPGFEVDQKVLVVTGTCADRNLEQAHMLTNGEAIPIKLREGAFSAKTVLRPGQNNIVVVAENDVGTSEAGVWGTAHIQAAALKVVLTWEAQGTDIDLWVTDPQGVVTNYHHRKPAEGRNLDVDVTSGPGMETYTIEVPLRGSYDVAVHYFAAKGWQGPVPFRLRITTWEATFSENRSGTGGTLYTAARDREEQGAVVHFTVGLQ